MFKTNHFQSSRSDRLGNSAMRLKHMGQLIAYARMTGVVPALDEELRT